jgi:oxygen-independent coproporphyrinogen III oxidase
VSGGSTEPRRALGALPVLGSRNAVRGYGHEARPASVAELLRSSPFVGYGYAYPHKTAYRPLPTPRSLAELWAGEDHSNLFLYVHVPFCGVRCGFCNLFTQKHPAAELPERFLDTLARQIEAVAAAVPEARFTRWAIGGGTPTLLDPAQLERVFGELERAWPNGFDRATSSPGFDRATSSPGFDRATSSPGFDRATSSPGFDRAGFASTPGSVETSPETCDDARLAVLEARGTARISIGVQSFFADELRALGRPQAVALAEQALDRIRRRRFATLNIDLIYGIAGQTPASFVAAIDRALSWAPEQLYLYPLYQRPLTGLGRHGRSWDDQRLACLRAGRDHLRAAGYRQVSLRMFEKPGDRGGGGDPSGPAYCCQADGMIGLGVGARSYTRALHYADDWAVGNAGIREIIAAWIERSPAELGQARYGIVLDGDEQRRRWLIQSLLQIDGLDRQAYRERFASEPDDDFAELAELVEHGLLIDAGPRLIPSDRGLEWADAIAPWLYSEPVRAASREFELR